MDSDEKKRIQEEEKIRIETRQAEQSKKTAMGCGGCLGIIILIVLISFIGSCFSSTPNKENAPTAQTQPTQTSTVKPRTFQIMPSSAYTESIQREILKQPLEYYDVQDMGKEKGYPSSMISARKPNSSNIIINVQGTKDELKRVTLNIGPAGQTSLDESIDFSSALLKAVLPEWSNSESWLKSQAELALKSNRPIVHEIHEKQIVIGASHGKIIRFVIQDLDWKEEY
ncbi:hypothetical protein M7775_14110 [Sporomusa sphaeroides DSM 2875]|uniref:hypothetical protein n=1 Tax=Sporomusa sphaeroides TaxID=47679 RepID=UPI00202FD653|nr:hypothetical protein [Sporomusa sphaeroides]MCM0759690.1 hypothetical protein [Sporomusa sphaeroides DSM 2875]